MNTILNVAIIGAGNIAAGYDNPDDLCIQTHAHAIIDSMMFQLSGFYDIDKAKANAATAKWGGRRFESIDEISAYADIVCIAVPDQYHYPLLRKCLEEGLFKAIIIEKPFVTSYFELERIINIKKKRVTPIFLNYSRRYMEEFQYMKKWILENAGELICGNCYYGKGTLHNGSHLIDLMRYLFGDMEVEYLGRSIADYLDNDLSMEFSLNKRDNNSPIFFHPIPCNCATVFEFDIFFSNARIQYSDERQMIKYYTIVRKKQLFDENNYQLYRKVNIDISHAMRNLYANVFNVLNNNCQVVCDETDGEYVVRIIEELRREAGKTI